MGAVTYPDERVTSFVNRHFAAAKINLSAPRPEDRELLRSIKPQWAPVLLFYDSRATELRRTIGYLAPDDFLAELHVVLGLHEMLHGELESSHRHFRSAADDFSDAAVAPEALFWAGAAAYKRGGKQYDALRADWLELQRRFPASSWARRADVLDMTDKPRSE